MRSSNAVHQNLRGAKIILKTANYRYNLDVFEAGEVIHGAS